MVTADSPPVLPDGITFDLAIPVGNEGVVLSCLIPDQATLNELLEAYGVDTSWLALTLRTILAQTQATVGGPAAMASPATPNTLGSPMPIRMLG